VRALFNELLDVTTAFFVGALQASLQLIDVGVFDSVRYFQIPKLLLQFRQVFGVTFWPALVSLFGIENGSVPHIRMFLVWHSCSPTIHWIHGRVLRPRLLDSGLSFGQPIPVLCEGFLAGRVVFSRTNHWLVFGISHATDRNPEGGYSFSDTRRDLFTNLAPTTFRKPNWFEVRPPSSTTRFLQRHWTNFPALKFLKPTDGKETAFQRAGIHGHIIGPFKGRFYSGVRFTVPEWMDGDFEFALVHLYRSADELRRRPAYSWGIVAERGEFYGFKDVERVQFQDLPERQARYPFTEKAYTAAVKREYFVPGKTYVLWQYHYRSEGVVPDLELAMTIVSARGREEFGEITWR
jgi:hypothetical protein